MVYIMVTYLITAFDQIIKPRRLFSGKDLSLIKRPSHPKVARPSLGRFLPKLKAFGHDGLLLFLI